MIKADSSTGITDPALLRISNLDSTNQRDAWWEFLYREPYPAIGKFDSKEAQQQSESTTAFIDNEQQTLSLPDQLMRRLDNYSFWSAESYLCQQYLRQDSDATSYFAGVLRTAYLYNKNICLTDAELLDGILFQAFGPTATHQLLGLSFRDKPVFTVHGRGRTLRESLMKFVIGGLYGKDGNELEKPTNFSVLRCSRFNQRHVPETSESHLPPLCEPLSVLVREANVSDAIRILASACNIPVSALSLLKHRWQSWIDAERKGWIIYRQCAFNKEAAATANTLALSNLDLQYSFAPFRSALYNWDEITKNDIIRIDTYLKNPRRSEVLQDIYRDTDPTDLHHRKVLSDIYKFAYQRALADQHKTDWITIRGTSNIFVHHLATISSTIPSRWVSKINKRGVQESKLDEKQQLSTHKHSNNHAENHLQFTLLSSKATEILGQMPAVTFTNVCYDNRELIDGWRNCDRWDNRRLALQAVKNVDYAINKASEQDNPWQNHIRAALSASVVAISAIIGWSIGAFMPAVDTQSPIGSPGFWWMLFTAFATGASAIIPDLYATAVNWWDFSHSDSKTLITRFTAKPPQLVA